MFSFLTSLFSSSAIKIGLAAIILLAGFYLYARGEHFRAESIQAKAQVERLQAEIEGWKAVSQQRQAEIDSRDKAIAETLARYEEDRANADQACQAAIAAAGRAVPIPKDARVLPQKDSDESISRRNNLFPAAGVLPADQTTAAPGVQTDSTSKKLPATSKPKGSSSNSR